MTQQRVVRVQELPEDSLERTFVEARRARSS